MNLFTLIAGAVLFAILLATLLAWALVLWFGRKKSWRTRAPWLGISTVPAVLAFWGLSIIMGPVDVTDPVALHGAYLQEFGEPPPPDVHGMRCRQYVVGDAGGAWMTFQSSPQTIDRLLPRFAVIDLEEFLNVSAGGSMPSWWEPEQAGMVAFYRAEGWSPHFQNSTAVLAHDRSRGVVYFNHSGFD